MKRIWRMAGVGVLVVSVGTQVMADERDNAPREGQVPPGGGQHEWGGRVAAIDAYERFPFNPRPAADLRPNPFHPFRPKGSRIAPARGIKPFFQPVIAPSPTARRFGCRDIDVK